MQREVLLTRTPLVVGSDMTPIQRRLVEAGGAVRTDPVDDIAFQHSVLCQVGLPLRDPGDQVRTWARKQGAASLRIEAGAVIDPRSGDYIDVGLPHSEKARLVLIHLTSEAIRTGLPEIEVAGSLTAFVADLGLPTSGRSIRTVRDQLTRLSTATVRLGWIKDGGARQGQGQIVERLDLWAPEHPGQRMLWPSVIRLSDAYFASVREHAVPLDQRAVGALSHSALALDIYCWLAHRFHRLDKPLMLNWGLLHGQFGQGWKEVRFFRRKFLLALRAVLAVYDGARVEPDKAGLLLRPSPTPIASVKRRLRIVD
jgi:hypothetical protein